MSIAKPRIAVLLPDLRGGGAERVNLDLAREEYIARGYAVDFVLMRDEGELRSLLPDGINVVNLNAPRLRSVLPPLVRYIREARPDAILASMWPLTSVAVIARRLAGSKARVVVSDHTLLSHGYAGWGALHRLALRVSIATTYRLADGCVAVSDGVRDDLSNLSGIPRKRFDVIFNSIPPPSELELPYPDATWNGPPGRRILTVGSFKPVKNHALLISAFARLRDWPDARLMLLGDGPLRAEITALVAAEGLSDRVLMPGFVRDPGPYYRSADLFVLSSDYEGFGNVIVEALACGVPVVSTDCPSGPTEILEGGRHGRLVPVGNAAALAEAMRTALGAQHDRAALQRRAGDFTVKRAADRYLSLMFPNSTMSGLTGNARRG